MSPLSGRELAERLTPETARVLRVLAGAMGAGVLLLAAVVAVLAARAAATPTPDAVRLANGLTAFAMAAAFTTIVASEFVWRRALARASEATIDADARRAFVGRTALREGGAVLGAFAALVAAQSGVLRAYPAYWVDLVPAALFASYLYLHWPSLENLRAEAAEALPAAPSV